MLLHADSCPVHPGCLEALSGHSGITEAYENGVVWPTGAIQTNKGFLDDGQLAINRKFTRNKFLVSCLRITVKLKGTDFAMLLFTQDK